MSLQQVLMMTSQQAQTTTTTQYYLPNELWGLVLHNITDDYTLWVVCRQVSRLFRSEAEREFLLHRLPSLTLSWDFMFPHHDIDYELHIKQAKCLGIEAKTLSRVKFSFSAENKIYRKDTETVLSTRARWQGQRFKRDVDALFSYKDMSSLKPMLARDGYYRAMLGYYSNDVPLPNLQYDVIEQTLSFDWMAFANNFFKDAKFVQSRFNTTTSFTDIAEDSLGKFFTKYNMNTKEGILKGLGLVKQGWQEQFEKDFNFFWQEAYVKRLRRTNPLGLQRLEGKDETGVKVRKKMAKYFQPPRQAWCTDVVIKYCEKRLQQLEIDKL